MPVTITIRDVPDDVRDELASRAARSGRSLQSYLSDLLAQTASRPTTADVIARARARTMGSNIHLSAETILEARDADRP